MKTSFNKQFKALEALPKAVVKSLINFDLATINPDLTKWDLTPRKHSYHRNPVYKRKGNKISLWTSVGHFVEQTELVDAMKKMGLEENKHFIFHDTYLSAAGLFEYAATLVVVKAATV